MAAVVRGSASCGQTSLETRLRGIGYRVDQEARRLSHGASVRPLVRSVRLQPDYDGPPEVDTTSKRNTL